MTMPAEANIRAALDGHFYAMQHRDFGSIVVDLYVDAADLDGRLRASHENPYAPARRHWTADEDKQLMELRLSGMCWSDIGRKMKISKTLCWRRGSELGLPADRERIVATKRWTKEEVATLSRMMTDGISREAMASRLGRSRDSVHHMITRLRDGRRATP